MLLSVILSLGVAVVPALILHLIRIPAGTAAEYAAGPVRVRGGPELPTTPELAATLELPTVPELPPPVGEIVTRIVKPEPRPAPSTTVAPTTTTTTTKPAEAAPAHTQTGQASWYGGRKGECAHRTIPLRTLVKVVNLANGRETHCTVTNRGPRIEGRIIDLTKATFAELAPVRRGVINVRLEW